MADHKRRLHRALRWGLGSAGVVGVLLVVWLVWTRTYHFAEVRPGVLYRDGVRSMREFENTIGKAGIRTVIMLNDDAEVKREPFKTELEFCRQRGIQLVRIPIAPGQRPETQQVQKFLQVLDEKGNWPVLVHCAQGVRRTGMMAAAYQMTVMGWDKQRAKAEVMLWGRKPDRLDDVRGFIDDYDPVGRSVGNEHVIKRGVDAD